MIGRYAALPPEDPIVRAIWGHPVWKAFQALELYYRDPSPIEEEALTARAFGGPSFFEENWRVVAGARSGTPVFADDALELALDRVCKAPGVRRRAWLNRTLQLMELDERTGYKHHCSGLYINEPIPPDDFRPFRPRERAPEDPGDDDYAGLAWGSEEELSVAIQRFRGRVWREDQEAAAHAFWVGLREVGWAEIDTIAGRRRRGGRLLHPKARDYWRRVYKSIAAILRLGEDVARYDRPLVRPQEWRHWSVVRGQSVTAHQTAALFVWDRLGRPGSLTTLAQKLGSKILASTARVIDPGAALAELYFAEGDVDGFCLRTADRGHWYSLITSTPTWASGANPRTSDPKSP